MRALILALLFMLTVDAALAAGDDFQTVGAVWSDFVASLRRGDYRNAHSLFSAESRLAMPYAEFVAEYGPLSSAREMVLAKPESQSTQVNEDWAEIAYGGVNPDTGRRFKVGVSLVRNHGVWGLVAARNEASERVEAQVRGVLRAIWVWRGQPEATQRIQEMLRTNAANPLFRFYRVDSDGQSFRAMPLREGLRAFFVDPAGQVRAVGTLPAAASAPSGFSPRSAAGAAQPPLPDISFPPEQPPPATPPLVNGLPELSEPPPFSPFRDEPGEMSEPPPPDWRRAPSAPRDRAAPAPVALPDNIE